MLWTPISSDKANTNIFFAFQNPAWWQRSILLDLFPVLYTSKLPVEKKINWSDWHETIPNFCSWFVRDILQRQKVKSNINCNLVNVPLVIMLILRWWKGLWLIFIWKNNNMETTHLHLRNYTPEKQQSSINTLDASLNLMKNHPNNQPWGILDLMRK